MHMIGLVSSIEVLRFSLSLSLVPRGIILERAVVRKHDRQHALD